MGKEWGKGNERVESLGIKENEADTNTCSLMRFRDQSNNHTQSKESDQKYTFPFPSNV
jgi:hypothetical protein